MMEPHERLAQARRDAGYKSRTQFSKQHGIPITTYYNHENGHRKITMEVAEQYAPLLGVTPAWILVGKTSEGDVHEAFDELIGRLGMLPVVGRVAAGTFTEGNTFEKYEAAMPANPKFARHERFALEVEGDSMDKIFPAGCVLECVSDVTIESGDYAVIERNRGGLYEQTVKRVHLEKDTAFLIPESNNPKHERLTLPRRHFKIGECTDEITVKAKVVGFYRPL